MVWANCLKHLPDELVDITEPKYRIVTSEHMAQNKPLAKKEYTIKLITSVSFALSNGAKLKDYIACVCVFVCAVSTQEK